jgi:hypothetical protein
LQASDLIVLECAVCEKLGLEFFAGHDASMRRDFAEVVRLGDA